MAKDNKGKGSKSQKGGDKAAPAADEHESKSAAHDDDHASAKEAHAEEAHGAGAHAAVAGHAHAHDEHKPNRKEYWIIFVALLVLTVLEVGIAQPSLGISKNLMRLGLVGMALAKAVLVALFYMHLKHETRVLRLTVAIPLATPALYAVVLISEAAWRLIR